MKAYKINLNKIDEGYLFSEFICHAESLSKAKSKLLEIVKYDSLCLKMTDVEVKFINIPVVRAKEYDLIEYNGQMLNQYQIRNLKATEKHNAELDAILVNESTTHCYIKKRGDYYRDDYNGYVHEKIYAGLYPKIDACKHARNCEELTVIPIINEEHNQYINSHIERLKSRLL